MAVTGVREVLSPNRASRHGAGIDTIVLHHTGTRDLSATLAWFSDPGAKVSAHWVVDHDAPIVLCVPEDDAAWHAGRAELWGETNLNERSIGIELVGTGDEPWPDRQLGLLIDLLADICWRHRIPLHRVVGHAHVARPLGRKHDPGRFPWFEVLVAVGAHLGVRLAEAEGTRR